MTTVGEYLVNVVMTSIDDGIGVPNTVNSFQVLGAEGQLVLRQGNPGEPGIQGPPAFPWKWKGDVADYVALQAIETTLTPAMKGFAYRVVGGSQFPNSVMYWDGEAFYPFLSAFGAEGPRGLTPTITVGTIETLAEGEDAYLDIDATDPLHLVLNGGFPQGGEGEQGVPGGPGAIIGSPDVKPGLTPTQGSVLIWDDVNQWYDQAPYPGLAGPYGLSDADFSSGSNVSTGITVVATKTIPPQAFAWRPIVEGGMSAGSHVPSIGAGRVDVEVRIGSSAGQIVAFGAGFPSANAFRSTMIPHFGGPMTPGSSVGVIAPNTTVTLYVILKRNLGTSNYSWTNNGACMYIYCQPVFTP